MGIPAQLHECSVSLRTELIFKVRMERRNAFMNFSVFQKYQNEGFEELIINIKEPRSAELRH